MQALDHAAGYMLALGIQAALHRTIIVRIYIYSSFLFFGPLMVSHRKAALGKSECPLLQSDGGSGPWVVWNLLLHSEKGGLYLLAR